ncbi:MAG: glycosyltransferase [Flectobacillus sp.]|nr:glycosyltransferase [Flectobacillus sp.]
MKTPEISVLMSVYNEPIEWLRQSVDSILNQTFKDFEFIIIIDKPDATEIIFLLEEYKIKDERILLVKNEVNIGLTKSLNIGLKLAKGNYIARMDADDIALSHRFETQLEFLRNNSEYILCGSYVQTFDDNGKKDIIKYPISDLDIKKRLLIDNCIAHPTIMFVRNVVISNEIQYNESCIYAQDYDFFVSLVFLGKFTVISECLLMYRISPNQISRSKIRAQTEYKRAIQQRYLKNILAKYNLTVEVDCIEKKVSSRVDIPLEIKQFILSSLYSLKSPFRAIVYPIFIDYTVLTLGKLYFSSYKRARLWQKLSTRN